MTPINVNSTNKSLLLLLLLFVIILFLKATKQKTGMWIQKEKEKTGKKNKLYVHRQELLFFQKLEEIIKKPRKMASPLP